MIQMPTFKHGEKVRIIEGGKRSDKTYIIKKIFESEDGVSIYFLKSEKDRTLRLFHQDENTGLERIS